MGSGPKAGGGLCGGGLHLLMNVVWKTLYRLSLCHSHSGQIGIFVGGVCMLNSAAMAGKDFFRCCNHACKAFV